MPSVRYTLQIHLLLSILLLTSGQRLPPGRVPAPPRQDLQTPNFDGESFERFGGGGATGGQSSESQESSEENSAEMREQLKQLLGEQLANAFAPLATTPFSRRPGIIAPSTGAEARAQFAENPETNEENEDGDEEESNEEEPTPQPQPQLPGFVPQPPATAEPEENYNPWRDNFYDLNEDGSYIFGYAIPHGVRRWEKGYYSEDQHSRVVKGFYVQPRHLAQGLGYELRCYIADSEGYHSLPVEYLIRPPSVRRDEEPQVNCFNNHRKRI
ncbi:uncharacterized protein LOC110184199 [Drosophila serrata]|uniref:uncharacterized protein LOC110184199 n=1 Tax=Drosophila serrata TaxID=7274 RepID=UPI000A1D152F|nr:uncharacterized protein LOC110184199 [Drosophila serrata]